MNHPHIGWHVCDTACLLIRRLSVWLTKDLDVSLAKIIQSSNVIQFSSIIKIKVLGDEDNL